ncbi:MAG TPA: EthD family reductase [Nocardioides sp.]|jgi:uncharacterized protein (TIGR02118 family)|nr:EthD family reductase [Nocardioides sp.]
MSIEKHVVLVESRDEQPDPGLATTVATELADRGRSTAEGGSHVAGLTISTPVESLTGTPRALAVVQLWVDVSAGVSPRAVIDRLVAGLDLETSSWHVGEIVFRAPTEREEPGADHQRVNLFGTAFKRDDFDIDAFFDYWVNTHAPISGSVPGLGGYVVSRVQSAEGARKESGTDAFIELWYPDRATFDAAGASPQQAEAWTDVQRYAKTTGEFWITTENVVVPPPATGPGTLEQGQ